MRRRFLILMVFSMAFVLQLQSVYAFDNKKTHPAITERAAIASIIDDYLITQLGLSDGINTQLTYNYPSEIQGRIQLAQWLPEKTQRPVLEWLKVGSAIEDEDGHEHPARPRHHFCDPTRNAGLNNKDDNPRWTGAPNIWPSYFDLTGQSALAWAVNGTAPQNPTTNNQSWHNARADFYDSLTKPLKTDRDKYLAMTFLDLGCVLHMIEDMGVPAHTRNDFLFAHYRESEDYSEPLERWIEKMIRSSGSLDRWISPEWTPTPKVFGRVSDYFDTDTRDANNYLGDGVLPPANWGLSEASNYQFLSWTTIFREPNSLYYFPHPARIHTTEVNESGRVYLSGYGINRLAKRTMSFDLLRHDHLDRAWCTLGKDVFDDYARMSIPRTIEYATGLINYFFRGKLSIEQTDCNNGAILITITNKSSNSGVSQILKGGTFELYYEDVNGNRSKVNDFTVTGWIPGESSLAYDAKINATFPTLASGTDVNKCVLIYKGPINDSANPDNTDEDDSDAIAVGTFEIASEDVITGIFANNAWNLWDVIILSSGNFAIIYTDYDYDYLYFKVIDASGSTVVNQTLIYAGEQYGCNAAATTDGFLIAWSDYDTEVGYFKMFDNSGQMTVGQTAFNLSSETVADISADFFSDGSGKTAIFYTEYWPDDTIKMVQISPSGGILSRTTLVEVSSGDYIWFVKSNTLFNGNIALTYTSRVWNVIPALTYYYLAYSVIDKSGTFVVNWVNLMEDSKNLVYPCIGYYSGHKLLVASRGLGYPYNNNKYTIIDIDGSHEYHFNGTAESGTLTSLVDSSRTEPDDYFIGDLLKITAGTGIGEEAIITDYNSGGTFHFSGLSGGSCPNDTSHYAIDFDGIGVLPGAEIGEFYNVLAFANGGYRIYYRDAYGIQKHVDIGYDGTWSSPRIIQVAYGATASSKNGIGIFVYTDDDDAGWYIIYKMK